MDLFPVVAECAIALAGFGAVHAMIRGSDGPRGMARAWCVVAYAGYAAFLAFLPLLLDVGGVTGQLKWQLCSMAGLIGGLFVVISLHLIDRKLAEKNVPAQVNIGKYSVLLIGYLVTALMALNLIGWPTGPGAFLFGLGLLGLLAAGFLPLFFSFLIPLIGVMRKH